MQQRPLRLASKGLYDYNGMVFCGNYTCTTFCIKGLYINGFLVHWSLAIGLSLKVLSQQENPLFEESYPNDQLITGNMASGTLTLLGEVAAGHTKDM